MSSSLPLKLVRCCFTGHNPWGPVPPVFFSPCTKFLFGHILNMAFRDAEASEKVQKLALTFVKGLLSHMKQLCSRSDYSILHNGKSVTNPWSSGFRHGVPHHTSNSQKAMRPRLSVSLTEMLYPPSPIRFHHYGCTILVQITG